MIQENTGLSALLRGLTNVRQIATDADTALATVLKDKTAAEKRRFVKTALLRILDKIGTAANECLAEVGASDEELHQAGTEEPVVPGTLPPGADGTPEAAHPRAVSLEALGLKLCSFGGPGLLKKHIGKLVNPTSGEKPVQIFEIEVNRPDADGVCRAMCLENGRELFTLDTRVNFSQSNKMAIATLLGLLKTRRAENIRKNRKEKAKRAARRAAEEAK